MTFILKMAWRDSRASRRRLALFSLSVVLGIAALVAIGSFSDNLKSAIQDQAKGLLGADLSVTSRQAFTPEVEAAFTALGGGNAREVMLSSMAVFPSAGGATRLVQVRALEGAFPFYGEFETEPAGAFAKGVAEAGANFAVIEETLLLQFNLKVGDTVRIGKAEFAVAGVVKKIPGESMAVATLSPRIFIPMRALAATQLLGPSSLVRHRAYFKLPPESDAEAVVRDWRQQFRAQRLGFDTVEERKRDLGRAIENVDSFLSLVGFIALFLGAIGVASAIHVYVRQKITTVAVLRCLGASARQSFGVYLAQGFGLGLFGATLGAALGVTVQFFLPLLFKEYLPFHVDVFIAWAAVGRGAFAGLTICLLFTLLPLLAVRRVSPLVALRSAFAESPAGRPDPWRILLGVLIVGAVLAFAMWQTRSVKIGAGFAGMLALGFGVLAGMARGVSWAARKYFPKNVPYVWRQGLANLYRPNNRTVLLLLSLGLGTFLIVTLFLTRTTLLRQIQGTGGGDRPNLLLFDIQDDQMEPLAKLLAAQGAPVRQSAPIVTMKISAIKGRTVEELRQAGATRGRGRDGERSPERGRDEAKAEGSARIPDWTLTREYRSTYRGTTTDTEKIVAGKFTGRAEAGAAVIPISIEQGLAKDMQVTVGDEMTFDVQGVPMRTRITSVREVEWRRMEPNFFVVFPTGVLEAAPKFFVAAVRAATGAEAARVQRAVVADFPNVSAIDLALILQTLDGIFSKVAFVVQFMAMFTVVTGIIVLAGAVLTGRYQRIRETVLLRTLGATRRQLVQIQLVEYAILGVLAAFVGCLLAILGNWLLAQFVFHTSAVAPFFLLMGALGSAVAVTLLTGLLANRGITNHPPLEVLRQET